MAVLDAHCRERLAGLRQQQEDLGTLLAQLNVVAQELERSTAKDDTKLLMARILDHVKFQRIDVVDRTNI